MNDGTVYTIMILILIAAASASIVIGWLAPIPPEMPIPTLFPDDKEPTE